MQTKHDMGLGVFSGVIITIIAAIGIYFSVPYKVTNGLWMGWAATLVVLVFFPWSRQPDRGLLIFGMATIISAFLQGA